jgi:Spy/CpxP family protein refolding chaperone
MKIQTLFLSLALACAPLAAAGTALAQDVAPPAACPHGGHGDHRGARSPEARLEHMTAVLGLDANQQQLVRQIFEANRPRFQEIRQMTDETARHAAMQQLRESTHAQIDAVLTPAQRATMERMIQFRRDHRGGRGGRGARGGAPTAPPTGI